MAQFPIVDLSESDDKVVVVKGLMLEPGDKVLVTVDSKMTDEVLDRTAQLLDERFPDVEFTILHGAEAAVQKGST